MDQDFIRLLQQRRNGDSHSEVDCNLLLTKTESKPVLFYSIAHILKHLSRAEAYMVHDDKSRADEINLQRTLGWADEFFWLSMWSYTGKLKGVQDANTIDSANALFFLAVVQMEWGDLDQQALSFFKHNLFPSSFTPSEKEDNSFGIWIVTPKNSLEDDLRRRALKRLRTSEEYLKYLLKIRSRRKSEFDAGMDEALRLFELHLCLARARNYHCEKDYLRTEAAVKKALELDGEYFLLKALNKLISSKIIETTDLCRFCEKEKREEEEKLKSVHILGNWIKDMLLETGSFEEKEMHPRILHPKGKGYRNIREIKAFPNSEAIRWIEDLLEKNMDWLRFVTENDGKIKDIIEDINLKEKSLAENVIERGRDDRKIKEWRLYVLRDWGSYTPLLPQAVKITDKKYKETGGGGYFLHIGSRGVVIDPGFDYIKHFFEAKLTPGLITDIVVTHDHYDHSSSFGPLLNLLFKVNESFGNGEKKINFYLSRGVYDQYARFIVDAKFFDKIIPMTDEDVKMDRKHCIQDSEFPIELHTIHTEHGDKNGFGSGVGLVFDFKGQLPTIGISSDTGWYDQWKLGKEVQQQSLGKEFNNHDPDVMVLHVGSLKSSELKNSGFYKTHLGARGVFRTIDALEKCQLAVLSEFGEECASSRVEFANLISIYFQKKKEMKNFHCIPADRKTCIIGKNGPSILLCNNQNLINAIDIGKGVSVSEDGSGMIMFSN